MKSGNWIGKLKFTFDFDLLIRDENFKLELIIFKINYNFNNYFLKNKN